MKNGRNTLMFFIFLLSAIVVAIFLAVPYWKAKYFTRVAVKKGGSSNA